MMKNKLSQINVIVLLIGFLITSNTFAQEFKIKDYRIKFSFNTYKQADNSRLLEVSYIATNKKDRKDKAPIYEADIEFYNVLNDEELKLGSAKTNKEGIAQLIVPENQYYLRDKEGYINLKAVFEGTDGLKSKENEIAVKDIFLELDLKEIDSIKTVTLNAFTLDSLQTKVAIEELDVVFSIGGMLSKMPIEEATLENGEYEFEFLTKIPGDKQGNIEIYVSVIHKKTVNWGGLHKINLKQKKTLWSDIAPIWMYVVLTILLVGVWSNYIYSFINLLKIRKEGKEIESKENKLVQ